MITKKIEPTGDVCIKFTEDELNKLGIKEGDKFSFEEDKDGILLRKYQTLDIDISEFSREALEYLVSFSIEKDITIAECIEHILTDFCKNIGIDAQQESDTISRP
jgi:bifunctional DNA-binding transcriptional regulator/antitoxin component of YhaV-PrlF toxin-antitoxin module